VPKVFFTNDLYKKGLTDTEKIAFGMLKDRFELSKKNKWFDEKGRIYFIFSIENLMDIFDCSKTTAIKIKKSLIDLNLLEAKRRGRGLTDILYLKKPQVTDKDVYKIIDQEEKLPMKDKEKEAKTLDTLEKSRKWTSGSPENEPLEVQKMYPNDTDFRETDNNKTEKNLNPNPNEELIKLIGELALPSLLKDRVKIMIKNNIISLSLEQIFQLEEAYAHQVKKDYIRPECDFEYSGAINDSEFTSSMVKMLSEVKNINNMRGLVQKWVKEAFEYKLTQLS
jgi:hypothetical protein